MKQNKYDDLQLFIDFDGTITNREGVIEDATIKALKSAEILKVVVTGRTFSSFISKAGEDFPIDYLIFSTGAGIMNWASKELLDFQIFSKAETSQIKQLLNELAITYSLHYPVPDNHKFEYYQGENDVADFRRYLKFHGKHASINRNQIAESTQFLIITDDKDFDLSAFAKIRHFANIIKISSPIDHRTTWIEILPLDVSKSRAAQKLLEIERVVPKRRIAIGNDYNDLDLLDWADEGYLVSTAIIKVAKQYPILENDDNLAVANYLREQLKISLD